MSVVSVANLGAVRGAGGLAEVQGRYEYVRRIASAPESIANEDLTLVTNCPMLRGPRRSVRLGY